MKEIIVLFKTHLDVGFTDFAKNVVDTYIQSFIPKAMKVAEELRGREEKFIWTVGSWLIEQFLERADNIQRESMEEAIRHNEISWNGLPFTTHTELMDAELFTYGLHISKNLDKRFCKKTIAAKMTDVPGHTKAMIPFLYKAGIRFLHIGVNPASSIPDVPELFLWRADSGEEIIVMYNCDYGDFTRIPGTETAVYFAHTGDNLGPQSAESILKVYQELKEKYPDAYIHAGTLNDIAEAVLPVKNLPVVTKEIGDSWIHGVGSDPLKLSRYRALLRCVRSYSPQEKAAVYSKLLLVPEHTWGMDEKTHLGTWIEERKGEYRYFIKKEFQAARGLPGFCRMEKSWEEQRAFVTDAVKALKGVHKAEALHAVSQYKTVQPSVKGYEEISDIRQICRLDGAEILLNENGAIEYLRCQDRILADKKHLWADCFYEVFSQKEYDRFVSQYVTNKADWALEDFQKIGEEAAVKEYFAERPRLKKAYKNRNSVICFMEFEETACEIYGAPRELMLKIQIEKDSVDMDFGWFHKDASRIPEALWFGINPLSKNMAVRKLGEWIDCKDIVNKGGRRLHATDFGVKYKDVIIESLDAALVAPGKPSLLNFTDEMPETNGSYFNLYNNVWGTNFVMWYEEDARFRFRAAFVKE